MKTDELVKRLRSQGKNLLAHGYLVEASDWIKAADIITRQSATIKALTEALGDLLGFTEGKHVKPYNGQESVCHHPSCGESGRHLSWCPLGMAERALAQAREEE